MSAATEASPLALLAAPRPADWAAVRAAAEVALQGRDLPTTRDEDWKYTDLKVFRALQSEPGAAVPVDIAAHILPEARGTRLVFVNGHFDPHASNTSALPPGVRLLPLAQATEAAKVVGSLSEPAQRDVFANLNTARFQDGALLLIPKEVRVEGVLHVLFVATQTGDAPSCSLPRVAVVLERNAEATLLEEYVGTGQTVTHAVTEIHVAEGARLSHARVQRESLEGYHFATQEVRVERNARYSCQAVNLGARLSRHTPHLTLAAEGAEAELLSLALLDGDQVSDTHSLIDHTVPDAQTRQLHKTIVDGQSRAIFNGKIYVRPDAQRTNAQQQCRSLLLSEGARVDAKPELEIFADDVKCAHGAAIGQLDPEEVFYLQSRGLDEQAARNVLVYGFASEILGALEVPSLRKQLRQSVLERTEKA